MLTFNTFNLTSEQINKINNYRQKWQKNALSADNIDRDQARIAVNNAYEFIDISAPNIIFFSNPLEALNYIQNEINKGWGKLADTSLGSPVAGKLTEQLLGNTISQIKDELLEQLQGNLDDGLGDRIALETAIKLEENNLFSIIWSNAGDMMLDSAKDSDADDLTKALFKLFWEAGFIFNNYISFPLWQAQKQISSLFFDRQNPDNKQNKTFIMLFTGNFNQLNQAKYQLPFVDASSRFVNVIVPSVVTDYAYYIDYCHEVLGCDRDPVKWNIFKDLITSCGWIFPYEKTVLICDRE